MSQKDYRTACAGSFAVAVVFVAASVAMAQNQQTYDITHHFSVTPSVAAPLSYAKWLHFEHARAEQAGFPFTVDYYPLVQSPLFGAAGFETERPDGTTWNNGLAGLGWVEVVREEVAVVGPYPFTGSNTATAASGTANATGTGSLTVNAYTPGGSFTGTQSVIGTVNVPLADDQAFSYATSSVVIGGATADWRDGVIGWTPDFIDTVTSTIRIDGGHNSPWPRGRDPVNVRIYDATSSLVLSETLVDVRAEVTAGTNVSMGWQAGVLTFTNVEDGTFTVDASSQYVDPADRGDVTLVIESGLVVQSDGTGIFAGYLPAVGTPGTFSIPFPMTIQQAYTFPEAGPTMEIELGGGRVPEPATLTLLAVGGLAVVRRRRK
jgi:hypothetical protein